MLFCLFLLHCCFVLYEWINKIIIIFIGLNIFDWRTFLIVWPYIEFYWICQWCFIQSNKISFNFFTQYRACRLIGSRIIESAAYSNQILLVQSYPNSAHKTSVNWIIRLMLSLLCWPKMILLSSGQWIIKLNFLLIIKSFFHFRFKIVTILQDYFKRLLRTKITQMKLCSQKKRTNVLPRFGNIR